MDDEIIRNNADDGLREVRGGPMSGQTIFWRPRRGAAGVVVVDKPNSRYWIYRWNGMNALVCANPEGAALDEHVDLQRLQDETSYDVVARP